MTYTSADLDGLDDAALAGRVTVAGSRLTWRCDTCHEPVRDGGGYVHLDREAALHAKAHNAAIHKRAAERTGGWMTGTDLMDFRSVHWQIHHPRCDPDTDRYGDYWIRVERIRTLRHFIHWTGHLMGKTWIAVTDWDDIAEQVGEYA